MFKLCCNFCYNNVLRKYISKGHLQIPFTFIKVSAKSCNCYSFFVNFLTKKDILNRFCYSNVLQNMPGNALF